MKSVSKTVFAVLLVVLAVSAVGSASASAAECKHTAKTTTFCIENKPVTGEVGFTAASSYTASFVWEGMKTECRVADSGIFHPSGGEVIGVTNRVIELTNCTVAAPQNCATKPIVFGKEGGASGLAGELYLSGGAFQLNAVPSKGSVFGLVTFINANEATEGCLIAGTLKVTAKEGRRPTCTLPGVTTEAVEHKITCPSYNSNLKLGEEPFELTIEETIALSGANKGKKWSLWEQ